MKSKEEEKSKEDERFTVFFETFEELALDYCAVTHGGKEYADRTDELKLFVRDKVRTALKTYEKENVIPRPLTGTGVMIFKDQKILLGKRKGSHGAGEWAFPGGHLELGESFEEGVYKELEEETGIQIKDLTFLSAVNVTYYMHENPHKHYIHFGFYASWVAGEPEVKEQKKCEEWRWFSMGELPEPLFQMVKVMIHSLFKGVQFYDRDEALKVIETFDIKNYIKKI